VAAIAATFDTDYTTAPSGRPPAATPAPNLIWSPAARASFLQHIDQAAHSVDVTSEELKDRAVLSALDKAARRGVHCRIVLTDNPAWAHAVAEVSAAGCSVHPLPATKTALYMHEKVLLTDNTELIIGSQNLSTTSLLENRELSLTLDTGIAPALIAAVESTFDADFAAAPRSSQQPGHPAESAWRPARRCWFVGAAGGERCRSVPEAIGSHARRPVRDGQCQIHNERGAQGLGQT
jgi:phosphatidylserine/phosphatidylglycerophosphate/cardiolipin synthase-like enzyme